jgi:hypothetical protein
VRLLHTRPDPRPLELRLRRRQLAILAPARPMDSSLLLPPMLPLATPLCLLPAQGLPMRRRPFRQLMPLHLDMQLLQLHPVSLTSRQQLPTLQHAPPVALWHPLPPLAPQLLSPCRQLRLQLLPLMLRPLPRLLPCRNTKNRPRHKLDHRQVQ